MSDNERLSRELRNRADNLGGHPISFDDVKRSANKMKWQQRAAAGAVAAVVLAIAVPVGFAVTGGDKTNGEQINVATNTPTPTQSLTPTQNADGKYTLTVDAPQGDAPHISWMDGKTLHTANGDTFELPKAYDDVVSYHGGFMGFDFGSGKIDVINGGQVTDSFPGSGFAVSVDGTQVAWYDGDTNGGQLKLGIPSGMGEGEQTVDVPAGYLVTPLRLTPSTRLVYSLENQSAPYDKTIWYTDFAGDATQIKGAYAVTGYDPVTGSLALITEVADDHTCSSLYSYGGGDAAEKFGEKTCDFQLGAFSSDGKYVIGWPSYYDGWGPGVVSILDATTLKPVASFDKKDQDYGVQDARWDSDSDSLIASVYLEGKWQMLRLGVDGSIEAASTAVQADDVSNPFVFVDVR